MQVSVYGEGDAGVQWGVRVGVDASVDFSELFPDIIASILDDIGLDLTCLLYTSPSPRDRQKARMPSSA